MSTARTTATRPRCCQTAGCSSAAVSQRSGSYLASAEIYDPALGTWSLTGSMSTPALPHGHSAARRPGARQRRFATSNSGILASAEIYDPALGTWSLTGSMSTARAYHTATLLPDGRVLVSGGHDGNSIAWPARRSTIRRWAPGR